MLHLNVHKNLVLNITRTPCSDHLSLGLPTWSIPKKIMISFRNGLGKLNCQHWLSSVTSISTQYSSRESLVWFYTRMIGTLSMCTHLERRPKRWMVRLCVCSLVLNQVFNSVYLSLVLLMRACCHISRFCNQDRICDASNSHHNRFKNSQSRQ